MCMCLINLYDCLSVLKHILDITSFHLKILQCVSLTGKDILPLLKSHAIITPNEINSNSLIYPLVVSFLRGELLLSCYFVCLLYSITALLPSLLHVLDLREELDCLLRSMDLAGCVLEVAFNLSLKTLAFSLEL